MRSHLPGVRAIYDHRCRNNVINAAEYLMCSQQQHQQQQQCEQLADQNNTATDDHDPAHGSTLAFHLYDMRYATGNVSARWNVGTGRPVRVPDGAPRLTRVREIESRRQLTSPAVSRT